ncbi:MAG: hypothetical protein NC040_04645 [Muribaculaceae bacterium]|nr:hypothetical protein [Alistipes senegalensis]MCM1473320.1 hypothetical protein [Muribaculaceae bacterium]
MNKNNPEINQEFEKMFRDKMNELSSSVDCFDRISSKAFPEKNPDFSESGFTVCDLENITGKSKKPKILKWTAIVVACAVCAFVIPQTRFVDNLIASLGSSSKKIYSKIIDEINAEISQNTYRIYDLPLDDYIKYDRLVTPLYSCPFKECGKDNINVRIFVRTYDNIPTNQIYAVEYTGEYKNSNFIAVADTKAKFTDDDLKYIDEIYQEMDDTAVSIAIMANFTPASTAESFMTDRYKNKVSLASFDYGNIFKSDDEKIYYNVSQFIYYGDKMDENPETYYYDINKTFNTDDTWKNAVCFDGFSSLPEESESLFVKTSLFDREKSSDNAIAYGYVTTETFMDYSRDENKNNQIDFYSLSLKSYDERSVSTLAVPYDNEILKNLKMYFSQSGIMFSSDSNASVILKSANTETTTIISPDSDGYYDLLSEEEQAKIYKAQEEQAKLQEEMEQLQEEAVPAVEAEEEQIQQAILSSDDERFILGESAFYR